MWMPRQARCFFLGAINTSSKHCHFSPKLTFCWHAPFTVGINSELVFFSQIFFVKMVMLVFFVRFVFNYNKRLIAVICQFSFNWSKYFVAWSTYVSHKDSILYCWHVHSEHAFVQTSSSVRVLRTKCKTWSTPWYYFRLLLMLGGKHPFWQAD